VLLAVSGRPGGFVPTARGHAWAVTIRTLAAAAVLTFLVPAVAACTSSERRAINETVARNAVAVAGTKQFRDDHHPLDGLLSCRTRSRTTTKVTVACHGTTTKQEPVSLLGATSDARQVKGHFVGTVAGTEVFATNCLGC
jgi:hypothetical protein